MARKGNSRNKVPPDLKMDMSRIFRISLSEKMILEHPGMSGFGYRNVTMLVETKDKLMTVSFVHPNRMPTFEEIRTMMDRLLPGKHFMIPLRLHTLQSHMISAIELPPEAIPVEEKSEAEPLPEEVKT